MDWASQTTPVAVVPLLANPNRCGKSYSVAQVGYLGCSKLLQAKHIEFKGLAAIESRAGLPLHKSGLRFATDLPFFKL